MPRKELLPLSISIVVGFLPWFLEQKGIAVQGWIIDLGGIIALLCLAALLHFPIEWIARKFTSAQWTLSNAISLAVVVMIATTAIWWWLLPKPPAPPVYDVKKWASSKNEFVTRKRYFNETVELDGYTFDHCNFENVKFVYHGTANTSFLESTFSGSVYLETDNQAAKGFALLMNMMSTLPQASVVTVGDLDPATGNVTVLSKSVRTAPTKGSPKPKN